MDEVVKVPWMIKIFLALAMTGFLLHLPIIPPDCPEVQIITVRIGHD